MYGWVIGLQSALYIVYNVSKCVLYIYTYIYKYKPLNG